MCQHAQIKFSLELSRAKEQNLKSDEKCSWPKTHRASLLCPYFSIVHVDPIGFSVLLSRYQVSLAIEFTPLTPIKKPSNGYNINLN